MKKKRNKLSRRRLEQILCDIALLINEANSRIMAGAKLVREAEFKLNGLRIKL